MVSYRSQRWFSDIFGRWDWTGQTCGFIRSSPWFQQQKTHGFPRDKLHERSKNQQGNGRYALRMASEGFTQRSAWCDEGSAPQGWSSLSRRLALWDKAEYVVVHFSKSLMGASFMLFSEKMDRINWCTIPNSIYLVFRMFIQNIETKWEQFHSHPIGVLIALSLKAVYLQPTSIL